MSNDRLNVITLFLVSLLLDFLFFYMYHKAHVFFSYSICIFPIQMKERQTRVVGMSLYIGLFTWVCTHPLWPLFLLWEKGVSGMTPMPYFFGFSFKFFPSLALCYYLDRDD